MKSFVDHLKHIKYLLSNLDSDAEKDKVLYEIDNIIEATGVSINPSDVNSNSSLLLCPSCFLWLVDEDFNILYVSPSFSGIVGLENSLVIGKSIQDVFWFDDSFYDLVKSLKANVSNSHVGLQSEVETYSVSPAINSTVFEFDVAISIVYDDNSKFAGVSGRCIDVTKIREKDRYQQGLNEQKDKLFSIIAHDLKSPIANIAQFCDILQDRVEDGSIDDDFNRIVGFVSNAADRTFKLLDNLLIWARSQQGKLEMSPSLTHLKTVVNAVVEEQLANAEVKNISLVDRTDSNCIIYADASSLEVVLRNLLQNAIKFSFPHSEILIKSKMGENFTEIEISDFGVGMSDERRQNLFSVNKYASQVGTAGEKGTGIGLYICYDLVKKNDGIIEVKSEEGNGSSFFIRLPNTKKGNANL